MNMSIEQEKKIDFIADSKDHTEVILFITDHLSWDESGDTFFFKYVENFS